MNVKQLPFLFLGFGILLAVGFFMIFGQRSTEVRPASGSSPITSTATTTLSNSSNSSSSSSTATFSIGHESARLLFTGDIMLGRFVETLWKKNGEDYPFSLISDTLHQYDSAISNLEGPIPDNHVQTPIQGFDFSFASSTAKTLKRNGVDIVSLANNHTANAGDAGFVATHKYLSAADVLYFGNPLRETRDAVLPTEINGVPFVFVGFNATLPSFDSEMARGLVRQVHEEFPDRFLLVFMHWGDEYQLTNNALQKQIAHALIDNGADAIIGAHPHVVESIEQYKGKMIFYSLGNFIFDQYFSADVKEGLMVEVDVSNSATLDNEMHHPTFTLLPVDSIRSQPKLMPDEKKTVWLKALAARSDASLKTQIESGVIDVTP